MHAVQISPMMKHKVAVIGITAQVSPMEGLYTASAVPTMKPPPTQVAVSHKREIKAGKLATACVSLALSHGKHSNCAVLKTESHPDTESKGVVRLFLHQTHC